MTVDHGDRRDSRRRRRGGRATATLARSPSAADDAGLARRLAGDRHGRLRLRRRRATAGSSSSTTTRARSCRCSRTSATSCATAPGRGSRERNWTVGLVAGDPQYAMFNPVSLFTLLGCRAARQPRLADRSSSCCCTSTCSTAGVFWAARALGASTHRSPRWPRSSPGSTCSSSTGRPPAGRRSCPASPGSSSPSPPLLAALDRPDRPWRAVVAGLAVAAWSSRRAARSPCVAFVADRRSSSSASRFVGTRRRARCRELGLVVGVAIVGRGARRRAVARRRWPTSTYTRRQAGSYNNGFLTFHLESLLMSFTPSVRPFTGTFQGWRYLDQPVTYGSWLFAGAVARRWSSRRVRLRPLAVGGAHRRSRAVRCHHRSRAPRTVPLAVPPRAVRPDPARDRHGRGAGAGRSGRGSRQPATGDRRWSSRSSCSPAITFMLHASRRRRRSSRPLVARRRRPVRRVVRARDGRRMVLVGAGLVTTFAVWVGDRRSPTPRRPI